MFAPGGTPHSHNEGALVSDEAGWPTWNGGGCKCYAGVFCCAADALVDLIGLSASSWGAFGSVQGGDGQSGNASFVYQALDGACSCNGTPCTINKRDNNDRSFVAGRDIRTSDSSGIFNRISEKHRRRAVIAKAELERKRSEPTRTLVERNKHSPTWNKYAPSGVKYWNEFNNRGPNQPDEVFCNFDQTWALDKRQSKLSPPAAPFQPLLIEVGGDFGVEAGSSCYSEYAYWPKGEVPDANAEISNLYSPKDKVIIVASVDRQINKKGPKAPDHWSTIAWHLWKEACVSVTKGTKDFSNLNYMFVRNVVNPETSAIFDEALKGLSVGENHYFYPKETSTDTNAFWALLGSPNGNGLIHLLTDNKIALRGKSIVQLGVYQDPDRPGENGGYETHMWVELTK